jgi:hypothetical protein
VSAVEAIHEGLNAAKARGVRLDRPTKVNAHRDDVARLRWDSFVPVSGDLNFRSNWPI